MATFRIALADALLRQNQADEARSELEGTVSALSRQLERWPEMQPIHDQLALAYSKLEIALRQAGETELAEQAARKAEQERKPARRSP